MSNEARDYIYEQLNPTIEAFHLTMEPHALAAALRKHAQEIEDGEKQFEEALRAEQENDAAI